MPVPARLGLNHSDYRGERIDIAAVLHDISARATEHGWRCEPLATGADSRMFALRRSARCGSRRLYFSTGAHGDEPAGPLAVRALLERDRWPDDAELWLCPCLNPTGFDRGSRETAQGIDLNRDYRHLQSAEARAHVGWLQRQPRFDRTVCLHEDWEAHGFYVYELNSSQQAILAPRVIAAVAPLCPIDESTTIDGRPAQGGVILPAPDPAARSLWPEAVYLFAHHTTQAYTLEAPSDFALALRVAALVAAAEALFLD